MCYSLKRFRMFYFFSHNIIVRNNWIQFHHFQTYRLARQKKKKNQVSHLGMRKPLLICIRQTLVAVFSDKTGQSSSSSWHNASCFVHLMRQQCCWEVGQCGARVTLKADQWNAKDTRRESLARSLRSTWRLPGPHLSDSFSTSTKTRPQQWSVPCSSTISWHFIQTTKK